MADNLNAPFIRRSNRVSGSLSKTGIFWLFNLAFIALATPAFAVIMHGLVGFLPLIVLALIIGAIEGTYNQVLRSFGKGISDNKLLVVLVIWYIVGGSINQFLYVSGAESLKLLMDRFVFFIGVCFALGFARDERCRRYIQILFIFAMGIQAVFSINVLAKTIGISRDMWAETRGGWIHGSPTFYANSAMLLPVLFWRSFRESGSLRMMLIVASVLIVIMITITTFGTPLGLVITSLIIIPMLSILLLLAGKRRFSTFIVFGVLTCILYFGYKYFFYSPLLSGASDRIERAILDPRSGGYSEQYIEGSRWYLSEISLKSYRANPLWGAGGGSTRLNPYLGGHSSFFDILGAFGLFGGGGAFCGIVLLMLVNSIVHFLRIRNWGSLMALTSVILYTEAGIVNPYWEGMGFILVLSMARPFKTGIKYQLVEPGLFRPALPMKHRPGRI